MKSRCTPALVVVLALTQAACDRSSSSSEAEARPLVAAFNAVPDMGAITFLREEEVWTSLRYGTATEFRDVGADQYDLNFDTILPGDEATVCSGRDGDDIKDDEECSRLVSTSINVIGDHEYVVALLGRYESLRVQVYDKLVHEFDTSTSDGDPDDETTEVQFFHWADDLPALDVYLERPGANLSPTQARATLTSGGELHAVVDDGEYVITLAPVADPSHPLFTSQSFALEEQTRVAFAILGPDGDGTSTIKIVRFRDQSGTLLDRRVGTEVRVLHVATDAGVFDVYADEDFARPFVASLAENAASPYIAVPSASVTDFELDVTPAGNPGVLLGHEEIDLVRGGRSTFVLFDTASGLDGMLLSDALRRFATHAQVRMVNASSTILDFFIVPAGSNINTLSPSTQLVAASSSGLFAFDPKRYDIVLTRSGTDEMVFGPIGVDLAGGGIYTVIATGDATAADAVLFDDFAN